MRSPAAAARCARKCTRCVRIRARSRPPRNVRELLRRLDAGRHSVSPRAALQDLARRGVERCRTISKQRFDIGWDWVPPTQRHGREAFYQRFLPFKGGKKHQPQDAYCLRCMPQVHGAVRDACAQACRVIDIELNAVTDNPLIFPGCDRRAGHRGSGDLGRPFPRHAARAGDELRQGGDPGAGVDLRAAPQQAGRSGHQRRPARVPDRQRGRDRFGFHDRAVHRRGAGQRSRHARASGVACIRSRPARTPRITSRWAPTRHATCWR